MIRENWRTLKMKQLTDEERELAAAERAKMLWEVKKNLETAASKWRNAFNPPYTNPAVEGYRRATMDAAAWKRLNGALGYDDELATAELSTATVEATDVP